MFLLFLVKSTARIKIEFGTKTEFTSSAVDSTPTYPKLTNNYLIDFQLYDDAIRFKFYLDILG